MADVTIQGTELTTNVSVSAPQPLAGLNIYENVLISDVHAGSTSKLGTISSVSINGHGKSIIKANALRQLQLTDLSGVVQLQNGGLSTGQQQSLALSLNNADASINEQDVYRSVDVNLVANAKGNASILHGLTGQAMQTVNVSGDGKLEFGASFAASPIKTLQVAGNIALLGDTLEQLPQLALLDLSENTLTSRIKINPHTTALVGSKGVDLVHLGDQAISQEINLGAGNDTLTLGAQTILPTTLLSGGEGVDTLELTWAQFDAMSVNPDFTDHFSDFENWTLTNAGKEQTLDMALLTGVTAFSPGADFNKLTLHNFPQDGSLLLQGASSGKLSLDNPAFVGGGSDGVKLQVQSYANTGAQVLLRDVENLAISSIKTNERSQFDAPQIEGNALKKIEVEGDASLSLVMKPNQAVSQLALFDASRFVGANLSWTASSLADDVTVKGSLHGNNQLDMGKALTSNIRFIGGTGNDRVTVGAGANTISVGSGADIVSITAPGKDNATFTTILDPHHGMRITLPEWGAASFQAARFVLNSPTASLQNYLDAVAVTRGNASSNAQAAWFQFGNNTYYVQSHHDVATATHFVYGVDIVVKLVGLLDLSLSHLAANNALTIV